MPTEELVFNLGTFSSFLFFPFSVLPIQQKFGFAATRNVSNGWIFWEALGSSPVSCTLPSPLLKAVLAYW